MFQLRGYTIASRLPATSSSQLYIGLRDVDGLPVVLKTGGLPTGAGQPSPAAREYELLCRMSSPSVVKAVALEHAPEGDVLVIERFRGLSLEKYLESRGRLDLKDFFTIALAITQAVEAVHRAQIVHKDIKLDNVLINPADLSLCLIDFGISAELGRAQHSVAQREAQGTLHYIAPEQTGRIGLGVDFRTDLYSLGAALYELLTGQLPFASKTSVDLIHAHLSLVPARPETYGHDIPSALSRCVMRLLEKDPERRYQTAAGLRSDLCEMQTQWLGDGRIADDFVLGKRDGSDRLRFGNSIYGRGSEASQLEACFQRVLRGGSALALIHGPAGIGKTTLAGQLRPRLLEAGSYFAQTKFDAQRDAPYAGFAALLRSLLDQILIESGERLEQWSHELIERLGPIGGALRDLAPDLPMLIDLPPVPPLPPAEARERLALVVARFLGAFGRPLSPLVLLLDDLQNADAGSLSLLESVLVSKEVGALLVIATAREETSGMNEAVRRVLAALERSSVACVTIPVGALSTEEVNQFLADALHRSPADTSWLSELVSLKTLRNPLLVRRLLEHLWERDLLRYEHERRGWVWDPLRLAEIDLSDDAASMMLAKLTRLAPRARELLSHASLIGDAFDSELLRELVSGDRIELLVQLTGLVEQGLLAPCREGFKFVHDRIRESARALLSTQECERLHRHIASRLLEQTPEGRLDERAFEIADHLNQAGSPRQDSERLHALVLNLRAGKRALRTGAAVTAGGYLGTAHGSFTERDWHAHAELGWDLHLHAIEAAYQVRDIERAFELLGVLEARPLDRQQWAQLKTQRIRLTVLGNRAEALQLALDTLRRLGIRWPALPSWLRVRLTILRTDRILRRTFAKGALPIVAPDDSTALASALVVLSAGAAFHGANLRLACLATSHSCRVYCLHGAPPQRNPSLAIAAYTSYRLTFLGHLRDAASYARVAEAWMRERPAIATDCRAEFDLQAFVWSWLTSRKNVVEGLKKSAQTAREAGDVEFVDYAITWQLRYLALCGEKLPSVLSQMQTRLAASTEHSTRNTSLFVQEYAYTYGLLLDERDAIDWDTELERARQRWPSLGWRTDHLVAHRLPWILVLCIFDEHARAAELCEEIWPTLRLNAAPGSYRADYLMLCGLCHAALAEQRRGRERRAHVRVLEHCLREVRRWVHPDNDMAQMALLLEAERARARGKPQAAVKHYGAAAQQASDREYRHLAALAHERRASYLRRLRRETEADAVLRDAMARYEDWGASAKVRQLATALPLSFRVSDS